jgi:hypothetical protein
MDTKKFKNKLDKISNVFESMQADQSISGLEQELLKKYVIQLYETLLDDNKSKSSEKKAKKEVTNIAKEEIAISTPPIKEPVQEVVAPLPVEPEPVAATPPITEEPEIAQAQSASASVVQQSSASVSEVLVNELNIPTALKPIFEKVSTVELSDKLSHSKVKDISTAMGINEKIFTITELFGGDQNLFSTVTSKLNACTSYDEAVKYLSSTVARDQNWGQDGKVNKAKVFMKLVQRKFV